MSVYVDPIVSWGKSKTWKWSESCHMFADTLNELHSLAEKIGLKRAWFQDHRIPHYDLTVNKRKQAIRAGAGPVTLERAAEMWEELFPVRRGSGL